MMLRLLPIVVLSLAFVRSQGKSQFHLVADYHSLLLKDAAQSLKKSAHPKSFYRVFKTLTRIFKNLFFSDNVNNAVNFDDDLKEYKNVHAEIRLS